MIIGRSPFFCSDKRAGCRLRLVSSPFLNRPSAQDTRSLPDTSAERSDQRSEQRSSLPERSGHFLECKNTRRAGVPDLHFARSGELSSHLGSTFAESRRFVLRSKAPIRGWARRARAGADATSTRGRLPASVAGRR